MLAAGAGWRRLRGILAACTLAGEFELQSIFGKPILRTL